MKLRWLVATLILLAVVAACAAADDINPPWWRKLAGTTFAKWEFGTADTKPAPDAVFNPNGLPVAEIFPGHAWNREYAGRLGVWPLSGLIVIDIPNYGPPNPYKLVWIQITWTSESPYAEPVVDELLFKGRAELVQRVQVGPVGAAPWWHDTYLLKIVPNPTREVLRVQGAVWVDEVVVDTYCVPEPSTAVAFGSLAGLLGFALRRRR
ncbi:MAG: PEP-CTERM sorting domain-containing protein [Armatimonadota bacterium]|nr:PEP-CTERM sorting domain-containing protein [Armatimonadota bacterium]